MTLSQYASLGFCLKVLKVHQALPRVLVIRLDPLQKAQGSQVPWLLTLGHRLLLG